MPVCVACQHDNPEDARFCNQCGRPVAPPAAPRGSSDYTPRHLSERILRSRAALAGERKQVTILFADVKDSTRLAGQAGAETWHVILDRLFGLLAAEVHRFGGTVNQYTGDGIMALFGAPLAYEDHAVRACHAALAAGAAVRRYADDLRLRQGLNLSLRSGLNSGEVVVGRIGDDLRMDYTAQGPTVNLAARMEALAEPGSIYLTRHTAERVGSHFRLRDLGAAAVEGVDEPVSVYELEGVSAAASRPDWAGDRSLSRFVGREAEVATLETALARARATGRGEVVSVSGGAGVGKSRLCREFVRRCRDSGTAAYETHAVAYGDARPYFPVRRLLRAWFGLADDMPPETARRQVAGTLLLDHPDSHGDLAPVFDFLGIAEPAGVPELAPEQHLARLEAVCRRVVHDRDDPVVIHIEDAHWLDAGSEAFFRGLVNNAAGCGLLVVFTYRSERTPPWLRVRSDTEIKLSPLEAPALARLLAGLLGPAAARLTDPLAERAAGNPYFAEEAVRALVDTGVLVGPPGDYRLAREPGPLALPDTVQALLAERIDRLEDREKRLLEAAAVIGKTFAPAPLGAISELSVADRDAALAVLVTAGFIQPLDAEGAEYAFCHPLMQETAYAGQLSATRMAAHAALAQSLAAETGGPKPCEDAALVAHHWERADEPLAAARWQLAAAAWSAQRDLSASLAAFRRAAELAGPEPRDAVERGVRVAAYAGVLREAAVIEVGNDELDAAYREGRRLLGSLSDPALSAELEISNASRLQARGDVAAALAGVRAGLASADAAVRGRFRIPILMVFFGAGALSEGLAALADSGDGRWADGPITLENFASRALRAMMLAHAGDLATAHRDLAEARRVAEAAGRRVSWIVANQIEVACLAGNGADLLDEARTAVSWAEDSGSATFRELAYRVLAMVHLQRHEWHAAVAVLENSAEVLAGASPARQFRSLHLSVLAEARLAAGEDAAERDAREAVAVAERTGAALWALRAQLVLAAVLTRRGDDAEVPALLDAAAAGIEATGAVTYRGFHAVRTAEYARRHGVAADVAEAYGRAQRVFADAGAPERAARMAAHAAAIRSDKEEAS